MKVLTDTLNFKDSKTGESFSEKFEYPVYESVQEAINSTSEEAVLKTINRMVKVDSRNTASAKAQAALGINQRTLSEEQKLANKEKAKADRDLLAKIKANPELLASLGIK